MVAVQVVKRTSSVSKVSVLCFQLACTLTLARGLELLCVGLSDPLQPASLAPSALAAFGTASRLLVAVVL